MYKESYLDRKERFKAEGKVELPLNIDTRKYLIANLTFHDLIILSPFLLITIISVFILKNTGYLSKNTGFASLIPTIIVGAFQLIKHPIRKNLSFLQFRIWWRAKYNKRKKDFYFTKGEIRMANNAIHDSRTQLGIKNVYSGCYETTDGRFVKVLEVSSVNLSLMNKNEKRGIFEGYRTFINELQITKKIQISQIAQPINLSQYLLYVDRQTEHESNVAKRMLTKSYKNYTEDIQKSKNMVARKRYVIIDHSISSDPEKALEELNRKSIIIKSQIENMLVGYSSLTAKELNNDELLKLMYTCLDYDNALALGDYIVGRAKNRSNISLGERSAKDIIEQLEKQLKDTIN
jgi:hypothetical protein